jgi:deoxyadenosine/deoxycytidine kinase
MEFDFQPFIFTAQTGRLENNPGLEISISLRIKEPGSEPMGKIITVVGNLGAGKTTLCKLICDRGTFIPYWERPDERPFHVAYGMDQARWAFANQMDFFLFRCEQERIARQSKEIALFDGGFDQDMHVFTRHIYRKKYLTRAEFEVCQRFYDLARGFLAPPDLIIRIQVDIETILQRRVARGRKTDDHLFNRQELLSFELLLDEWLEDVQSCPVLQFNFDRDFLSYSDEVNKLTVQIHQILSD